MKNFLRDHRGFIAFLLCFGFFRLAIADWNPIPSGSMRPTLLEGDVVLVNRLAYDFRLPLSDTSLLATGNPQRGDVITFKSPKDGVRLIKRVVALPGDTVAMHGGVLFINGAAAEYVDPSAVVEAISPTASTTAVQTKERVAGSERIVQFLPEVGALRDFDPIHVPASHYFFLGDNRDNSADSRYIGLVPRELLIGRAHHIVVSANILGNWLPRWERIAQRIL